MKKYLQVMISICLIILLAGCMVQEKISGSAPTLSPVSKTYDDDSDIPDPSPILSTSYKNAEMTESQISELKELIKTEGLRHGGVICLPCDSTGKINIPEISKISVNADTKTSDFELLLKYEDHTLLILHLDSNYLEYTKKSVKEYINAKNHNSLIGSDGKIKDPEILKYIVMDIGASKAIVQISPNDNAFGFFLNTGYLVILRTEGTDSAKEILKDMYFTQILTSLIP